MRHGKRRLFVPGSLALGVALAAALLVVANAVPGTSRSEKTLRAQKNADLSKTAGAALGQVPQAVLDQANDLSEAPGDVAEDARPGQLLTDAAEPVLTGLGVHKATLYTIPTDKGLVCGIYSDGYGTFGCAVPPTVGGPINWDLVDLDAIGAGEPPVVDGLVPSDVTSVTVVADDGLSWAAKLGNGAFFLQLPKADEWPQQLIVERSNGKTDSIEVPGPPKVPTP